MKNKVTEAKIENLIPDNLNANKGTEYGQHLIESSMSKFGFGRSVLIDKNNRIIAGNKAIENAGIIGLEDVIIVETTGKQIVAVKRMDIDLNTTQGRELAIADNATAKANIAWDQENIAKITEEWGVDVEDWGITVDEPPAPASEADKELETKLTITCNNGREAADLFEEMLNRGFKCELKG